MLIYTMNNPATWFHEMRQEKPVYFEPEFVFFFGAIGAWQVFRYKDVQYGLDNYEHFSNELLPKQEGSLGDSLFMTDPPRHKQLRSLVNKAFVPSVVHSIEYWIREQCEALISPGLKAGKMDFIKEFAELLPARVMGLLLGIPKQNYQEAIEWTNQLAGDPRTIGFEAYSIAQRNMSELLMRIIKERQRTPQDDLITHLVHSEINGDQLSESDVVSFCIAMLTGGIETTAGLLGNGMLTFAERPEVQEHLISYPQDIPKAITEVLRFRSPLISVPRIARQDVQLNNQQIRKGEYISFWVGSANRDPEVFPSPDTFDLHRDNSKILSFGHGIHYCIGAYLARLETKIAFETIFSQFRNITIAPGNNLLRVSNATTCKYQSLKITFAVAGN